MLVSPYGIHRNVGVNQMSVSTTYRINQNVAVYSYPLPKCRCLLINSTEMSVPTNRINRNFVVYLQNHQNVDVYLWNPQNVDVCLQNQPNVGAYL